MSVIGLEDKRGITATVSSTAAGKMLGLQVLFESKGAKDKRANNRALPSQFERDALRFNRAGQKWDFYSTDTRWTQVLAAFAQFSCLLWLLHCTDSPLSSMYY